MPDRRARRQRIHHRVARVSWSRGGRDALVTTLVVVDTPGTGVLCAVAAGLARGARASLIPTVGYGFFAATVRDHVSSRPRVLIWVRRVFG